MGDRTASNGLICFLVWTLGGGQFYSLHEGHLCVSEIEKWRGAGGACVYWCRCVCVVDQHIYDEGPRGQKVAVDLYKSRKVGCVGAGGMFWQGLAPSAISGDV